MAKKPEQWSDEERALHDQLKQDWYTDVIEPEVQRANEQALGGQDPAADQHPGRPTKPPPATPPPTPAAEPQAVLDDATVKSLTGESKWGFGIAPTALWGVLILIVLLLVAFIPSLLSDDAEPNADEPAAAPAAPASPDDSVAQAAGTYRLTEASARRSLEAVVSSFESAEGAIVVETDGTVSGDFTFVYLDPFEDEGLARVTADSTLDPAASSSVTATETGLTFSASLIQSFAVVPPVSPSYTNPGTTTQVTGTIDPATGTLVLTSAEDSGQPPFEFVR